MSGPLVDESPDVAGFYAMQSQAAEQAAASAEEAPYGYTTDPDGTRRPKKTPGRPRKPPSVEELKAAKDHAPGSDPIHRGPGEGDRAPSVKRPRRGKPAGPDKPAAPVPQYREGVIAKGVNKLYRRAGKMVRVMDRDIGQALIDITRKEDDEDVTVGDAWEELARTNVRIRRFLLRIIAGGAWGQLLMCHAPILLAVLMKDAIRQHIPFAGLMEAFLDGGEDGEAPADGTPLEGLTLPDMGQMMTMAQRFAEQAMAEGRMAGGTPRPPAPGPVGPGVTVAVHAGSGS